MKMSEGTSTEVHDSEGMCRVQIPADAVRVGDTVVYTSRLDKEYRFMVAGVDANWITFETGQMVHTDRFEREAFSVVRADPESGAVERTPEEATEKQASTPKTD